MSKNQKLLLGIATFAPIALFLILQIKYMIFMFTGMQENFEQMARNSSNPFTAFDTMIGQVFTPSVIIILVLSVILYIGLMIFYIKYANKQTYKSESDKLTWIILFVLAGHVSFIIYYFLKILPEPKQELPIREMQ